MATRAAPIRPPPANPTPANKLLACASIIALTGDSSERMDKSQYQQAFDRIHANYLATPARRLTPAQVHRLSGADLPICKLVLADLVRAQFLCAGADGSYIRRTRPVRDESPLSHVSERLPQTPDLNL